LHLSAAIVTQKRGRCNFFAVTAKCGHVGIYYYYEGTFYERAPDAKTAAAVVRTRPRVKHDHQDAILWVREISYEEFKSGLEANKANAYFSCTSKGQQDLVWDEILPFLRPETERQTEHRQCNRRYGKPTYHIDKPKLKKPYKRVQYKDWSEEDFCYEY